MLDDPKMWWPFQPPEPHDAVADGLNFKLAAVHAPIAMAGLSLLLFFEHGAARIRFSHAMPWMGLVLLVSIVVLRFTIATVWNARADRLRRGQSGA
ncbi:MAG TPA: hypothetical protein VGH28_30360 [Polyangiaceae bacterium]|jgi:hypothetical protein